MVIDIIKNDHQPDLPWTFRLPFEGQKKNEDEPKNHRNGICVLTKAVFEYQNSIGHNYLGYYKDQENYSLANLPEIG